MRVFPEPLNVSALERRQVAAQAGARLGAWNCAWWLIPPHPKLQSFGLTKEDTYVDFRNASFGSR
jgi:hypothetical protein